MKELTSSDQITVSKDLLLWVLFIIKQKPPEQERKSSLKKKKEDGILAALKIDASKVNTIVSDT